MAIPLLLFVRIERACQVFTVVKHYCFLMVYMGYISVLSSPTCGKCLLLFDVVKNEKEKSKREMGVTEIVLLVHLPEEYGYCFLMVYRGKGRVRVGDE